MVDKSCIITKKSWPSSTI